MPNFLWNNIEFGIVAQEDMQFKDISYPELRWPLCSEEQNHLCSFNKGLEQFCEIIMSLDKWFSRRCFITFLILSEEAIMGNIRVKLFEIWTNSSGDVV